MIPHESHWLFLVSVRESFSSWVLSLWKQYGFFYKSFFYLHGINTFTSQWGPTCLRYFFLLWTLHRQSWSAFARGLICGILTSTKCTAEYLYNGKKEKMAFRFIIWTSFSWAGHCITLIVTTNKTRRKMAKLPWFSLFQGGYTVLDHPLPFSVYRSNW